MATAKPTAYPRPRSRKLQVLIAVLVLAAVAVLAWFWQPLRTHALTGAATGARIGCACRFIEGRSLADCRKDLEPGMGLVRLSEDAQARSVTASFPVLAQQTATFQDGPGCVLEKWGS